VPVWKDRRAQKFSAKRPLLVVSRIQTFLVLRTPDRAKGQRPLDSMPPAPAIYAPFVPSMFQPFLSINRILRGVLSSIVNQK
jgi:hypothetical protein